MSMAVSNKTYMQKESVGQIWPIGHDLSTPGQEGFRNQET